MIFTKHTKVKIVDPKTDGLGEKHFVTNQLSLNFGYLSNWWFQIFFIFTPTWGNDPI